MTDKNANITILVASNQQLQDDHYYDRLWFAARQFRYSRRQWREHLVNMLRDFQGSILYAEGVPYQIPLVDHVFGECCDMRWMSDYLKADPSKTKPLSRSRKFERLRLLDLYVRLYQPDAEKPDAMTKDV